MPLRILIADDEQPARSELAFQLEQLDDIEVVDQATDGPQAVSLAEALAPDVVLLDVQMPGLTGFEVARQLLERINEFYLVKTFRDIDFRNIPTAKSIILKDIIA